MKKIGKWFGAFLLLVLVVASIIYFCISLYYMDRFQYGTYINDIYVAGMSVEEANELLSVDVDDNIEVSIVSEDIDGVETTDKFNLREVDYDITYEQSLDEYFDNQNSFLWPLNVFNVKTSTLVPIYIFSQEKLISVISEFEFYKDAIEMMKVEQSVKLNRSGAGYEVVDTTKHRLDVEKVKEVISDNIGIRRFSIDLHSQGCYVDKEYTEIEQYYLDIVDKLNEYMDFNFSYKTDDKDVILTSNDVYDWLIIGEDGKFVVDEETGKFVFDEAKIEQYVGKIAQKFNTDTGYRTFRTAVGTNITIKYEKFRKQVDIEAEESYLAEVLADNTSITERTPQYLPDYNIGNTYIEVDLTLQKLYYFKNGQMIIESPIVSGDLLTNSATPAVVCDVYAKQTDRYLRGDDYNDFVHYWMPVYGNYGIHDAMWRSEFGGEIYKTSGSHGCVNMPLEAMAQVFAHSKIGTPVVIHH